MMESIKSQVELENKEKYAVRQNQLKEARLMIQENEQVRMQKLEKKAQLRAEDVRLLEENQKLVELQEEKRRLVKE